jgi:hypothetical protein
MAILPVTGVDSDNATGRRTKVPPMSEENSPGFSYEVRVQAAEEDSSPSDSNGRSVASRTVQKSVANQWQFLFFATDLDSLSKKSVLISL